MKPLFLLGLALFSGATLAADLKPFEASFAVSRNGKELGTMAMALSAPKDGEWLFVSRTEGKGGLAGFLGVTIEERSKLTLGESGLASTSYRYNQDMVGRHRARQLDITGGKATESDDDKRWSYPVEGNVLDRHSMVLGIATHLADGVSEGSVFDLAVASKGKLEEWRFLVGGTEQVDTGSGRIEAIRVERLRDNPERKTVSCLETRQEAGSKEQWGPSGAPRSGAGSRGKRACPSTGTCELRSGLDASEHRREPRVHDARGARTRGGLSLGYFSLTIQREVTRPSGRNALLLKSHQRAGDGRR
jgi:hypothetical protein